MTNFLDEDPGLGSRGIWVGSRLNRLDRGGDFEGSGRRTE